MDAATPGRVEKTIVLTRLFDAPRALMFELFTRAEHLNRWWGPECFTASRAEADPRVGGAWKLMMSAEQFGDSWVQGVYREVTPPSRLVFTCDAVGPGGEVMLEGLTTVEFAEEGDKTQVTVTATASGPAFMEMALGGMEQGWSEQLDKLEPYARQQAG